MTDIFNFDQIIDRRNIPSEKWDRYAGRDILPLWVADMDFPAADVILEAIRKRLEHGILGYTSAWPSLNEAIVEGILRDHGWLIHADWLVWLPGVVPGFNIACRATGQRGDTVFTSTPAYPPFLVAPANNERTLVTHPMRMEQGRWQWDREAIESLVNEHTSLFLLCNPHNPTGRVFDTEELLWLATLAQRHNFILCSDEIHCGLVYDTQHPHRPIAALDERIARRTITLMAPSKTWNIPALYCSFAIIPDPELRTRYCQAMRGLVSTPNMLGLTAAEAAYRDGVPWRSAVLDYLRGNRDHVQQAIEHLPGLNSIAPEATYLHWIDCRNIGHDNPAQFFEEAGVGLSDGRDFGMPGFVRLNFGCPRSTLDEALKRMQQALKTCEN